MLHKSGMSMVTFPLLKKCIILLIMRKVCRKGPIPVWQFARAPVTSQLNRSKSFQSRLLSTETRTAIDRAVSSNPVVLFMKGTPDLPQCGFSRASIQILGLQGVDPSKFSAFNVLEDEELRQGKIFSRSYSDMAK